MKTALVSVFGICLMASAIQASSHDHHHHNPTVSKSPTDGWKKISISSNDYKIQIPCKHKMSDHYTFKNGVHTFTVNRGDPSHDCSGRTNARSEMSLKKKGWKSGQHQFQAYLTIPKGTYNVNIFQIFGA